MKKRNKIIIKISVIFVVLASFSVFVFKFNLIDKFKISTASLFENSEKLEELNNEHDFIYETFTDEEGNDVVVEMEKVYGTDEEGNNVVFYVDTAEQINIFYNTYTGIIEKIEDNKIYFLVDKETKAMGVFPINVDDYHKVFDINNFDLKVDPLVQYSVEDHLWYEDKRLFSADDLIDYVGDYVRLEHTKWEDSNTSDTYIDLQIYNF